MTNKKISELNELTTPANDDVLPIVDTSEGETKKIQKNNLLQGYITDLSGFDTDDLSEGTSNLYFTDARAITALTGQNISIFTNDSGYLTSETDPIYSAWDKSTGITISSSQVSDFQTAVSTNSNVSDAYDKRVDTWNLPLTFSGNTASINQATTGSDGYLSSTDFNTFNSKEEALTFSTGLTRSSNTITTKDSEIDHNSLQNTHNLTTDIDHTAIQNIGTNSHTQIDTHISNEPTSSIAIHASNSSAHHVKYTDAEAVAAVADDDAYIKNTGDVGTGTYYMGSSLFSGQIMAEGEAAGSNISVTAQNIASRQSGNQAELYMVLNQNSQDIFCWTHTQISSADNDSKLYLELPDASHAITVERDGSIGLGTDSPSQKFDVIGDAIFRPDETWSAGDTVSVYLGNTATYLRNIYGTGLDIVSGDNFYFTKPNSAGDKFYWKHAGGTTLLTLDNDGDLTIVGELEGCRVSFPFGENTSHGASNSFYLKMVNGVLCSATKGYIMHRAGSIVGVSFTATISSVIGGNASIEVRKNGSAVYSITYAVTGESGDFSAYGNQSRGTDTFSAGDVIAIYYNYNTADCTIDDISAFVEVVYDS